jgi:arsenate reductase (glutaredoxin)
MTLKLYGIPNCDTVKKARCWLDDQGQAHSFHDFKKGGVPHDRLVAWIGAVGLDVLVNRRGPTFRKLDSATQARTSMPTSAAAVLVEHSSVIKRPVVEWPDGGVTVGFDATVWASRLK